MPVLSSQKCLFAKPLLYTDFGMMSPSLPGAEKQRGQEHVAESSDQTKIGNLMHCKVRALWRELDCPKPNSQRSMRTPIDTLSFVDAILNGDYHGRSLFLLRDGR
jgi:hypothetical protein